jgi:hypothetical protein
LILFIGLAEERRSDGRGLFRNHSYSPKQKISPIPNIFQRKDRLDDGPVDGSVGEIKWNPEAIRNKKRTSIRTAPTAIPMAGRKPFLIVVTMTHRLRGPMGTFIRKPTANPNNMDMIISVILSIFFNMLA